MKHCIPSRLAVLTHEDHTEFYDLLVTPTDEHGHPRPVGFYPPEDVAEGRWSATLDLAAAQNAAVILRKGGECLRKGATVVGGKFTGLVGRACQRRIAPGDCRRAGGIHSRHAGTDAKRFTPAFKSQTLGEGLRTHLFEKLNRYETHLDRKFERTLAMLLKLKDLRRVRLSTESRGVRVRHG
ncbi:hypothetical protein [Nitrosospira briensis]|uniref:hypothetical protein n=1 Tax=Nitrosospira briensis TaxID=35799 RepID=UPI0008DFAB90|nr:hypothetical protein [Nitrosospira briensis]SFN92646.1 hypothetical protein SAMN05216332_102369 [Nitrosospira briensis]